MLIFRSEDHLEGWLSSGAGPAGATMSLETQWDLARRWFAGRHLPQWKRRTAREAEDVFASVGLTDRFWKLS